MYAENSERQGQMIHNNQKPAVSELPCALHTPMDKPPNFRVSEHAALRRVSGQFVTGLAADPLGMKRVNTCGKVAGSVVGGEIGVSLVRLSPLDSWIGDF